MQNVRVRGQLEDAGLTVGTVHRNLPAAELTARALARQEGILAANGALVVQTGARTGRSPADRFIVSEPAADGVAWNDVNQACAPELFERMFRKAATYLRNREAFVFDGYAGAGRGRGTSTHGIGRHWEAVSVRPTFVQYETMDDVAIDGHADRG
jgi:phosphoenolpyruvate carboxykinase (ATP)